MYLDANAKLGQQLASAKLKIKGLRTLREMCENITAVFGLVHVIGIMSLPFGVSDSDIICMQ